MTAPAKPREGYAFTPEGCIRTGPHRFAFQLTVRQRVIKDGSGRLIAVNLPSYDSVERCEYCGGEPCPECCGHGSVMVKHWHVAPGYDQHWDEVHCLACEGTGVRRAG